MVALALTPYRQKNPDIQDIDPLNLSTVSGPETQRPNVEDVWGEMMRGASMPSVGDDVQLTLKQAYEYGGSRTPASFKILLAGDSLFRVVPREEDFEGMAA